MNEIVPAPRTAEIKNNANLFNKVLDGPVTVHLSPSISIDNVQAPTVWDGKNGIREWDKKWTVKESQDGKKAEPLSDFLLKDDKLKKMFEIGWKGGLISVDDIRVDPDKPDKFQNYRPRQIIDSDGNARELNENPYNFLSSRLGEDSKQIPEFPNSLTEKQKFDLVLLIYKKVTLDPYNTIVKPGPVMEKNYVGNPYLDEIIKAFGPEVNQYNKGGVNFKDQAKWLIAMNISTRKALDNWVLAESHTPTEKVLEKLEHRMVVPEIVDQDIKDEFTGKGSMQVTREVAGLNGPKVEARPTFEVDMMMSRVLEAAIPPDAIAGMEKDWQDMMQNKDYFKRGRAKTKLEKERQKWDMALLEYFGYEREMDGINNLAADKRKYFSGDERNDIANYKNRIGKRVESLGGLSGEFGQLNPITANLRKAQDVVVSLLDEKLAKEASKPITTGKSKKTREPSATEAASKKRSLSSELRKNIKSLLNEPRTITDKGLNNPRFIYEKTIEEMVNQSIVLKGLRGNERGLVIKILTDALKTRDSINPNVKVDTDSYQNQLGEGRLSRLDRKEGGLHRVEDFTLDNKLQTGLKGMDFMLRNILSKEKPAGEEFPGFRIVYDSQGKGHLEAMMEGAEQVVGGTLKQNPEVVSGPESSMSQKTGEVLPAKPESPPGPTKPGITETDLAAEAERNQWAVEVAEVLGENSGSNKKITGLEELSIRLTNRGAMEMRQGVKGIEMHLDFNNLNITSAADLQTISRLRDLYPEAQIQIDLLNVTLPEGNDKTPTTLKNFIVGNLTLSGSSENGQTGFISLEGSAVNYIEISKGNFVVSIDGAAPIRIDVKNGALIDLVAKDDEVLKNILTDKDDEPKTIFKFDDKDNARVEIVSENSIVYTDVNVEGMHRNRWDNKQKMLGENILVQDENGVYMLKPKPEAEAAPSAKPDFSGAQSPADEGGEDSALAWLKNIRGRTNGEKDLPGGQTPVKKDNADLINPTVPVESAQPSTTEVQGPTEEELKILIRGYTENLPDFLRKKIDLANMKNRAIEEWKANHPQPANQAQTPTSAPTPVSSSQSTQALDDTQLINRASVVESAVQEQESGAVESEIPDWLKSEDNKESKSRLRKKVETVLSNTGAQVVEKGSTLLKKIRALAGKSEPEEVGEAVIKTKDENKEIPDFLRQDPQGEVVSDADAPPKTSSNRRAAV